MPVVRHAHRKSDQPRTRLPRRCRVMCHVRPGDGWRMDRVRHGADNTQCRPCRRDWYTRHDALFTPVFALQYPALCRSMRRGGRGRDGRWRCAMWWATGPVTGRHALSVSWMHCRATKPSRRFRPRRLPDRSVDVDKSPTSVERLIAAARPAAVTIARPRPCRWAAAPLFARTDFGNSRHESASGPAIANADHACR